MRREKDRRMATERRRDLLRSRPPDTTPVAWHASAVADLPVADDSLDWIITDPPYERAAMEAGVYSDLGTMALRALRPGGGLVVLTGTAYLPEVIRQLEGSGLAYRWTLAYAMPGAGPAIYLKQINAQQWKPIIVYHKPGGEPPSFVNDMLVAPWRKRQQNDYHQWQQQELGMDMLVRHFAFPTDTVCDPFAGGGTIPLVAKRYGCRVVAGDIDPACVAIGKMRLENVRVGAGSTPMLFE